MNQFTRFLVDIGPLAVFFIAYNQGDLMIATGAFMAATAVALAVSYAIERRIPKMPLVTGVVGMVAATLILTALTFIAIGIFRYVGEAIGVTAAYAVFGGIFVVSGLLVWSRRDPLPPSED